MAKKVQLIPKDNNIIQVPLEDLMPDNYLPYAVEVAKERALPDVRDGLKPVHRRILYGAHLLKAFPDKPYFKSARIVGDILGKFHPHGDSSVYDAMVILAQNFSTREPLIDGHGNWGSIDGDSAAAMRYTEARLSKIALSLLQDIDKDTVDMVPNYSDSMMEPKVLPAKYPNLLVNGTFGIAVGLATNIPPHNLEEVIDGCLAYIDDNEITTKELMNYIKGPDLPTGGIIIGKDSLLSSYETGEGKVTLRAKTSIEKLDNDRLGIVITEFPFRRNKAKILQSISELTGDKKHAKSLELISDIRDESDRTGIRAVIEFKKIADRAAVEKVLKYLFKRTDLQCNVIFNMVALADGKPETLGLKSIITHYINHQKEIVTRRTRKELEISEKRYHIVEGFIKAINVLDDVIATIRSSSSRADAKQNIMNKFGFTDVQSDAILELMLYRLTGLEINVFMKEYGELEKKIKQFKKILESEKELLKVIKKELTQVKKEFGNPRRTEIIEDENEARIDLEDLIVVEDIVVTLSNDGFIKRVPLKTFNRSNADSDAIEYREGDYLKNLIKTNTTHNILMFTESGYMYQIKGNDIPEKKWKEKGERLDTIIRGLNLDNETIILTYDADKLDDSKYAKFVTNKGLIKKTKLSSFITNYSKLLALKLKGDEHLVSVSIEECDTPERFIKISTEKNLEFVVKEPVIDYSERNILGTEICTLFDGDLVKSVEYLDEYDFNKFILSVKPSGEIKKVPTMRKDSSFKVECGYEDDILLFTNKGNFYKFKANMFSNIESSINIKNLCDEFTKGEKVIKVLSFNDYNSDDFIYFFSSKGFVKKTSIKEFESGPISQICYKPKSDDDELISMSRGSLSNGNILIITEKGMSIKFEASSVNPVGKVTSGVVGISLKEEDKVIFASYVYEFIENTRNDDYNKDNIITEDNIIKVISSSDEDKDIRIRDIKRQNRAGRGSNIILLRLDDYIKLINII